MEPQPPAYNPYASPATVSASGGGGVTPIVLAALRETKPWVRLMSILGFIGSGLMILFALLMMVGAGFMKHFGGGLAGAGFGVIYLCLAFLYILPSLYLSRYASSIQTLGQSQSPGDLEQALLHQKSFWRFVGILTAIMLCLYAVGLVIAIVFAVFGAALLHH